MEGPININTVTSDGEFHAFCWRLQEQKWLALEMNCFLRRLDIRGEKCTIRMVQMWNQLPREVVGFPSLVIFKKRLQFSD